MTQSKGMKAILTRLLPPDRSLSRTNPGTVPRAGHSGGSGASPPSHRKPAPSRKTLDPLPSHSIC
jgi:hypothetical protein